MGDGGGGAFAVAAARRSRSAFVTFVMGDAHARMALALFQSLRDYNTSYEMLALVARKGAPSDEVKACEEARRASGADIGSGSGNAAPCEAVVGLLSMRYVQAFARLGVELRVAKAVERSRFTENIAGGPFSFWGAAYNKLQALALVEFSRVVWMDADTLALQSLDHLMLPSTPAGPRAFSAAFTIDCCVPRSPKMGGSLWVFQPSLALYERVLRKARQPAPDTIRGEWEQGDQRVVASAVGLPFARAGHFIESFPWLADYRQGLAPGLSYLPHHRGRSRAEVEEDVQHTLRNRFAESVYGEDVWRNWTYTEGPLPRHLWPRCAASFDADDEDVPVWHPLDARYDIMVGSCECVAHHDLAGRVEQDAVGVQMTAHFSCLKVPKPGSFEDELSLLSFVYHQLPSCQRWYYLAWHAAFKRAIGGPLLPAYAGPPVPAINTTHDALFARRPKQ